MTWGHRYQFQQYLRNSIWIAPLVAMMLALVAARLLLAIDLRLRLQSPLSPDVARTVLMSLAAVVFTLVVFVDSALLIALQLASAQLTPRVIGLLFRSRITKYSLSLFVFTFTFSIAVAMRIGSPVPLIASHMAAYSSVASLGVFLYLVDHIGKTLRPGVLLKRVARRGREVVEQVYPSSLGEATASDFPDGNELLHVPCARTVASSLDGVILAIDLQGLHTLAAEANCVIELVPQVGEYVAKGDPLFRLFGGGQDLDAGELYGAVAVGQERTLDQDPSFAFRIMVDIACKALSPAINDPTTAVLAIDQIHRLLRTLASRCLDEERVRDAAGHLRLVYRTPDWEDFVRLSVTEIRQFGGESIQVVRRLRAMLESLIETVPRSRVAPLRRELSLLQKSASRVFQEPEDRALADIGDSQGVGGRPVAAGSSQQEPAAAGPG